MTTMTTPRDEIEALRHDRDALVEALESAGAVVRGPNVKCPFHADGHPSGRIIMQQGGVWRYYCHAVECDWNQHAGDVWDVRAAVMGQDVSDVLREEHRKRAPAKPAARAASPMPPPNIERPTSAPQEMAYRSAEMLALKRGLRLEAEYRYTDYTGKHVMSVLRCRDNQEKKTFLQAAVTLTGQLGAKGMTGVRPLYGWESISPGCGPVLVVEGEKCVHALHGLGLPAVCWAGGAEAPTKSDWSILVGHELVLWPDNDDAGRHAMAELTRHLRTLRNKPASITQIDPGPLKLPEKGDVVDWLALGHGIDDVHVVIAEAQPPRQFTAQLRQHFLDKAAGKHRPIPWPWYYVTRLTRALAPGSITMLCGDPGDGKSLMLVQAFAHWVRKGYPASIYELEEDVVYHVARMLAQLGHNNRIIDDDYCRAHLDDVMATIDEQSELLEEIGSRVYASPDFGVDKDHLIEWLETRFTAGDRVCVIDPITVSKASDKPWLDDQHFIDRAKMLCRRHQASLVLVTHPTKQAALESGRKSRRSAPQLDHLAGGASISRQARCVLYMERIRGEYYCDVQTGSGMVAYGVRPNRAIHVLKARDGAIESSRRVMLHYEYDQMSFKELGVWLADANGPGSVAGVQPGQEVTTQYPGD